MIYPSSIHNHTEFCDGKSNMRQIAERAEALSYVSLGFSPHSPLPYENDWSMHAEDYPAFFAAVQELRDEYKGKTEIYAGVEWDADTPELPGGFDYVIGAVHSLVKNGERFSVDYKEDLLRDVRDRLYGGDFQSLCDDYFDAVAKAAMRERVQIVAHFDLVTKYNKDGGSIDENDRRYLKKAEQTIDAILSRRSDLFFEINTGVMARAGKKTPYPAPAILKMLIKRGARFVLTCDCHRADLLGAGYDAALRILCRQRGEKSLYLFKNGDFEPFFSR